MTKITPRELFLLSIGALLSVAASELFLIIKSGALIDLIVNFHKTSASIKLLVVSVFLFAIMLLISAFGYTNVFTLNNLARIGTAALGVSLTAHAALSGAQFGFIEGVILACIILLMSLYSLIEVYTALKISPKRQVVEESGNQNSGITPETLRAYLDSSKISYENLTGELRKRGIVFKKRDLTPNSDFIAATNALQRAGVNRIDKLDELLTKANAHADKIPFMLQQDEGGSVLQTKLIEAVAELYQKGLISRV